MNRMGAAGWVAIGCVLIVLGIILQSGIIAWLLNIIGWLIVIVGAIVVVVGIFNLLFGRRRNQF